jgi:outer membrane protein assembly factor BamB
MPSKSIFISLSFCLSILLINCKKNNPKTLSSQKAITSFVIASFNNSNVISQNVTGQFIADSIYLPVPAGTNLSKIVPTIQYVGESISPADTAAQNFNNPVTYTVTAADGSSSSYIVVPKFLSDSNSITSFVFRAADNSGLSSDLTGIIGRDTIVVYAGNAVNVGILIPSISDNGVKVSPDSGIKEDFSGPVVYTVTALSGATRKYTVIVAFNQVLYIGSNDGNMYALNAATGNLIWAYQTGGAISSSPTVAGGIVYFGSGDGNVYALNASNGSLKWKTPDPAYTEEIIPVISCPTVQMGVVYINVDFYLLALDAMTGTIKWQYNIGSSYGGSPTVVNGVVYDASSAGSWSVFAVTASTGSFIWIPSVGGLGRNNPTVGNGKVYGDVEGNTLVAYDSATGLMLYRFFDSTGAIIPGNNPTLSNGIVYVGSFNGNLYALNASNLSLLWQYGAGAGMSNPTVGNGMVFAASSNKNLCAVDANKGTLIWSTDFGDFSPDLNLTFAHGILYLGDDGGTVRAFNSADGLAMWSFQTKGQILSGPCVVDVSGNVFHPPVSGDQP